MGLDIHAASHLAFARPMPEGEDFDSLEEEVNRQDKCLDEVYFLLYPNDPGWEAHLTGMEPGLYEYTPATEQCHFRVGSYSAYNWWREQLSRFALGVEPNTVWEDPDRFSGRPFVELINFTDCDGRIGTQLAAKLAADFRSHEDKATGFAAGLDGGDGFLSVYREFAVAFEVAAQQGALAFC